MTLHSRKPHDEVKILRPSSLFSQEHWADRCAVLDDQHYYVKIYKKETDVRPDKQLAIKHITHVIRYENISSKNNLKSMVLPIKNDETQYLITFGTQSKPGKYAKIVLKEDSNIGKFLRFSYKPHKRSLAASQSLESLRAQQAAGYEFLSGPEIVDLQRDTPQLDPKFDKFSIKSSTLASRQSTATRQSLIYKIEEEEFFEPLPVEPRLARDNPAYVSNEPFVRVGQNELKYHGEYYGTPRGGRKREPPQKIFAEADMTHKQLPRTQLPKQSPSSPIAKSKYVNMPTDNIQGGRGELNNQFVMQQRRETDTSSTSGYITHTPMTSASTTVQEVFPHRLKRQKLPLIDLDHQQQKGLQRHDMAFNRSGASSAASTLTLRNAKIF